MIESLTDLVVKVGRIAVSAGGQQPFLNSPNPTVQNVTERAPRARCRAQFHHHLVVHVVEAVKLQVVIGHNDEARGESPRLCVQRGQSGHECLAAAVSAA